MKLTSLAIATMIALSHGQAVAQTITLGTDSKMGRTLICRDKWKALQVKPQKSAAENQAIEYGSQYFQKVCKRELEVQLTQKRN